jgi:cytidyltransferase-like protein
MKTVVINTWYFNPIHPWHIECMELSKRLWDELWIIVNNDEQSRLKTWKQEVFQDEKFRCAVVSAIKYVDEVMLSIDHDASVCESIRAAANEIRKKYWEDTKIILWKWGDRFLWWILEEWVCKEMNIEIVDRLWEKTHNSSDYRNKGKN